MAQAILASILLATVLLPVLAARDPDPRRGLGRVLQGFAVACVLYLAAVLLVYARFFPPEVSSP